MIKKSKKRSLSRFEIKIRLMKEQIKVIKRYYRNRQFFQTDLFLFLLYLFSNPYRICRKFLQKKGVKNIYSYGETPLTTLEKIVQSFDIQPTNKWLDLGSGRGRGCFWISEFWECQARGIEWVPVFISKASWIAKHVSSKRVVFQNSSLQEADFSWPDVVYLSGTCMSLEEIEALFIPMQSLSKGAKVITISEPLNHPSYKLIKSIPVHFIWGRTQAYLHIKE